MVSLSLSIFMMLLSTCLLNLASSLPFQAMALFLMSLSMASNIGILTTPLLGTYMVLIYSSGLLVLLAYFIALSPNQTLNSPSISVFSLASLSIFFLMSQTYIIMFKSQLFNMSNLSSSIITILNPSSMTFLLTIGVILIITMVSVVKILSISSKPMRPWHPL